MNLLLHPLSQKRYDQIVAHTPQSVLLVAPRGSGKESILRQLAKDILGEKAVGRLFELNPPEDKNSIGIEAIRELKNSLRLKSDKKRVILISQAHLMTVEAQNSFLKLLEEPPAQVYFLMGVCVISDVLQTIKSRTSVWRLTMPTYQQINVYFSGYPSDKLAKTMAIAGTKVGLISSLLKDTDHPLLHEIDYAKEILASNHFERLIKVDALSKDQAQTALVLEAMELICKAALEHAATKQTQNIKQWNKRLKQVVKAQDLLATNVQPKLVLSHLFMVL